MFKYRSYTEIPQWIIDYLLSVTGEQTIKELSLSEINGYLNGLMRYYRDTAQEF